LTVADVRAGADGGAPDPDDDAAVNTTHALPTLPVPLDEATVGDAMSAGVISCPPETPLRTVARMMATYRVHAIFVFDYGDEDDESVELWGLVSDLDLAAAACVDVDARTARGRAVTPLVTVANDEPLERAAQLMAENGIAHLAVVDRRTKRPIGVVSTLDIARAVAAGHGSAEVYAAG
jgi:CBS domain-containing protein